MPVVLVPVVQHYLHIIQNCILVVQHCVSVVQHFVHCCPDIVGLLSRHCVHCCRALRKCLSGQLESVLSLPGLFLAHKDIICKDNTNTDTTKKEEKNYT